jgi:hypothetical protein
MNAPNRFLIVLAFSLVTQIARAQMQSSGKDPMYVIVADVTGNRSQEAYDEVVTELAKLREAAAVVKLGARGLEDVFSELRTLKPNYVAFVVPPTRIEDNFVGAVFEGLTALDDDPYLDCAYGYVTGATAADALRLVRNTAAAQTQREQIPKKFVAIAHTFAENDLYPFAVQEAQRYAAYGYETATVNPVDNSAEWQSQAEQEIQKLNGASLVFLAGHGMGDMSCAIPGSAFGRVTLQAAIVVNGTCHSAVTSVRHDSKDRFWTVETKRIDPKESVCLNLIAAGAIGQFASTASSSWQNVAFAVPKFFNEGRSLGQALQESLNDKVRAANIKKIEIIPFRDGEKSPQALGEDKNPGGLQSFARVVLIGDPAYRPFAERPTRVVAEKRPEFDRKLPAKQQQIKDLIAELSDPEAPRFKALNELIRIGNDAVPPLIAEMKTNDNWQIPKALGAIGDRRAIAPLIEKLAASPWSPMREVVVEALQRLTGKDFGANAEAWKTWWKKEAHERE